MTQAELIPDPRALSMLQPWAWMVVQPGAEWKNVENRVKGFSHKSFRGDFLVHATECPKRYYRGALEWVERRFGRELASQVPEFAELDFGGIIGAARAVGMRDPCEPSAAVPWHMHEQYGFVLTHRRPLPFIECRGHLGFWRVPADVMAKIGEAA